MSKKHEQKNGSADHDEALADMYHRLEREMLDSFDEELEMELDDDRLSQDGGSGSVIPRNVYFKELFRLQGELVKLQDWVVAIFNGISVGSIAKDVASLKRTYRAVSTDLGRQVDVAGGGTVIGTGGDWGAPRDC